MVRFIAIIGIVGTALCLRSAGVSAQSCDPASIRAAVDQACPCNGFRNHGLYMKCVRNKINTLRQGGCDIPKTGQSIRCAANSVCGERHNPVVCCKRNGRPKIASADKCTAKGGTVMTGMSSTCDAACPTPPLP